MMSKGPLERRERLHRMCKSIIDNPRNVDGDVVAAFEKATMGFVHCTYDDPERAFKNLYESETETGQLVREAAEIVVKRLDNMETSPATGAYYPRTPRSFLEILDEDDDDDRDGGDVDDDDGDIEKQANHHASTVADLLVEAGSFPHRAAALQHLLHKPSGQALLQRMHKTEKELPMDKIEPLRNVVKQRGLIAVAKSIVDENRSYGISEHEFVALATEHAKAQHPELTEAAAFAKLYENPTVWRACNVLKSMPFVADVTPVMVGGEDTRDLSDTSKAIEQLKELGARRWPTASAAGQVERALTAPENHKLARLAVPIPQAMTSYPFPR